MKLSVTAVLCVGLITASACGGESGPSSSSVSGSWDLNITNLTAGGATCALAGIIMTVGQSGASFSGNYSGGVLTCTGSTPETFSGGVIKNGTVSGASIAFDLDSSDYHLAGTFTASGMSGTATFLFHDTGGDFTATGSFTATRHT